jgi:hypothetical protein
MPLRTDAGRSPVRLGLESLESRTLLSTGLPLPTLEAARAALHRSGPAPIQIHYTTPAAHAAHTVPHTTASSASYAYHWSVGPSAVVVGSNGTGPSTGSVDFALVRRGTNAARLGGPAGTLPFGFLVTTSSASASQPDHFNVSFTLRLMLRDAASGKTGTLTFKGTISGTLNWNVANLKATFLSPTTQKITLGNHVYTVSLPAKLIPNGPNDVPTPKFAHVQISTRPAAPQHH